jgi:hypothetical protein
MPIIPKWAEAVTLAAVACCTFTAAADAQKPLPLPQVTVTAPPLTPSWKKFTPYFGNPRVEEDKWPNIPCRDSRIGVAAAGTCKTGTPQEVAPGLFPGAVQGSNCRIAHDLVMTNLGPLTVEADVMVFDPYYVSAIGHQHKFCAVQSGYGDLREDFPDMNQMTRKGSGWRNFLDNGDLSTMEFAIASDECLALEKRGPRWGFGRVYVIHASICRDDRRPVMASDIDYVLGSLQVRTYEPRGNLRAPPQ